MRRALFVALALVAVWRVATLGQSALTGAQLNGAQLNGEEPTDTPTLTPTLTPTETPSFTPTETPLNTPTYTETPTPSHTLGPGTPIYTKTVTPTPTLVAEAGCCLCTGAPITCANIVAGETCTTLPGCISPILFTAGASCIADECIPYTPTPTATTTPQGADGCCTSDDATDCTVITATEGCPAYLPTFFPGEVCNIDSLGCGPPTPTPTPLPPACCAVSNGGGVTCISNTFLPVEVTNLAECQAILDIAVPGATADWFSHVTCSPDSPDGLCVQETLTPTLTPTPTAVTTPGCCACDGPACVSLGIGQFCPPDLNCVFDPLTDCRADACVTYTPTPTETPTDTPTITPTGGLATATPLFACCQDTAATPSPCINVGSNDSCPGGYNKNVGLVCGGGSVCTTPTPPLASATPTHTPTITPTPTLTPTPTGGPGLDKRGVPNLSVFGACPATPCPMGTFVPAFNETFGRRKVGTCQDYDGLGATAQIYCKPHSGYWQGTPIPVGTPLTCPDHEGFDDDFESCACKVTSGTGMVGCWIDRVPDATSDAAP